MSAEGEQKQRTTAWVPDLDDQRAETAQFVRAMLYSLRDRHVLLLSHAQNSRLHWPSLTNGRLCSDALRFGPNPAQHIALYGENLCHVRVRDHASDETPQWFAPDDDTADHGFASGLWNRPSADDGRVYYSTGEKPHTAKHAVKSASKIATRIPVRKKRSEEEEDKEPEPVIDTGTNAWNPAAVEIAVVAASEKASVPGPWAAVTHQLRRAPDYNATLGLPLPLHLAAKTAQYVLPHDGDPDESTAERSSRQDQ